MKDEPMSESGNDSCNVRHGFLDWLELHGLDLVACRRILDSIPQASSEPAPHKRLEPGYEAPDIETAWLQAAEAMRQLLPERKTVIDDTIEGVVKVLVDRGAGPAKAFTLDKGPAEHPVIIFSYRGDPSDALIIAHEFAHAVQIRSSRGKFLPPIMREICAFIGEHALLSYVREADETRYAHLAATWNQHDRKYLDVQKRRLQSDMLRPDTPYNYSWNYPVARYLAIELLKRCSREWIWSAFEGRRSVPDALQKVMAFPR